MPRHRYEEPIPYTSTQPSFEIPQLVPDDDERVAPSLIPEEEELPSEVHATQQILAQRAISTIPTERVKALPAYKPGRWFYDHK